jgi:hypothetical protein
MTRLLPSWGAFYSYITAGLGRDVGLGAGLLALAMYFCGVVLGSLVHDTVMSPTLS